MSLLIGNVKQLRQALRGRGADVSGKKHALQTRLQALMDAESDAAAAETAVGTDMDVDAAVAFSTAEHARLEDMLDEASLERL